MGLLETAVVRPVAAWDRNRLPLCSAGFISNNRITATPLGAKLWRNRAAGASDGMSWPENRRKFRSAGHDILRNTDPRHQRAGGALKVEAQVEYGCGVGQGADGDEIDPAFGNRANGGKADPA